MSARPSASHASFGHVAKRWLYIIHRWIGIVSCLFFAMWFASGLVMIYVPYPSLSWAEQLSDAQPIDWTKVTMMPASSADDPPRSLALEMRDSLPVWRIARWNGPDQTLPASRATLPPVNAAYASRVAAAFGKAPAAGVAMIARDQWTVAGGFDRHRPLWKVSVADPAGTQLYVSSSTGNVVQSTTRTERFWNWLGSVPHWLYPTIIRQDAALWRQVVMWVSGPCIAAAVTGTWIGLLRTRIGRRRFRDGRMTPYHGWMLWHHVAGLVGGILLLTWIVSGWLSVDPFGAFSSPDPDPKSERRYVSGAPFPAIDLTQLAKAAQGSKVVTLSAFAAVPLATFSYGDGSRWVVDLPTLAPHIADQSAIERAAAALVPNGRIIRSQVLTAPDFYWSDGAALPPLPMLRLIFDDPSATWLHIDPMTGKILERLDRRRRAYRWAYDLLHKWDVSSLTLNRPFWDIWLWSFSIFGLITSVSGIRIGWKRLSHRRR